MVDFGSPDESGSKVWRGYSVFEIPMKSGLF